MKKIYLFIFLTLLCGFPLFALAVPDTYTLNVPLPGLPSISLAKGANPFGQYFTVWYSFIIGSIGILATVMIMYAGFKWLTSRGNSGVIGDAKEKIFSAIIGLLLAFLSYTILNLINPNLIKITTPGMGSIEYSNNYEPGDPGWTINGIEGNNSGSGGGSSGSGSEIAACNSDQSTVIGGYNFRGYATSCFHVSRVNSYYQQMTGKINSATDAQNFINKFSPKSPITGQMVMDSAARYNVDPAVLIAEMTQDSSLGTAGRGARSNNPGNVGNTDNGAHCIAPATVCGENCCYPTWNDGVNAVANWLVRHRAK